MNNYNKTYNFNEILNRFRIYNENMNYIDKHNKRFDMKLHSISIR